MSRQICGLCPHHCRLEEGQIGLCRARGNVDGTILPLNYGKITSIALDPIEKKPLMRFRPGSFILSVGSFGCNLRCPFCQNHEISQAGQEFRHQTVMPEQLVQIAETLAAEPQGNLGVAFTYNEPLIGVEFLRDTAFLLKKRGMKVVLVTNGMMEEAPFRELLPLVDAMNIDLKAFHGEFYHWIGGDLETVKRNIRLAAGACHVEVTTLVIPGKNDSAGEMAREAEWLAGISPELPLHISRYFPRFRSEIPATEVAVIYRLAEVARQHLSYVYEGNC